MSASESSAGSSDESAPPPVSTAPYEKISCLGEGAFGAVWLARRRSDDVYVALKEVSRHVADPLLLEPERDVLRRISEAKSKDQSCPALAGLVETFVTPFAICMAMDLVEGTHLQDHLKAEGPMKEPRVQWYTAELAGALNWLHQAGWLYRDLKLTNVMLSLSSGSYGRVKLIDFGFAVQAPWSDKALGTLQTMAPEVISCANSQWPKELGLETGQGNLGEKRRRNLMRWSHFFGPPFFGASCEHGGLYYQTKANKHLQKRGDRLARYGPKADWWSLGAVLFELLTGEAPFGRCDDILLEGFQVLKAQLGGLRWEVVEALVSDEAKVAASSLCQLNPKDRPELETLKTLAFFGALDWKVLESDGPGPPWPDFQPLGFTIASAREDPVKPRRGAALPPTLEGPDLFENF